MDWEQREKTREALGSLLDNGQYQEFLDAAANMDDDLVERVVCDFAYRTIERARELGFHATRDLIEDFRERVVKASLSWRVRSRFNSAIRDFVERTNALRRIQEIIDYSHGTRQITRAELIQELNRILELSPRKARAAYRELVGSIALDAIPFGIRGSFEYTLMEFSMEQLKSLSLMVTHYWS